VPTRPVGVSDTAPGTAVAEIDVVERASPDLTTTTTADPGAGGTTLTVASAARFPPTNNFKVRVENEVMLVTNGAGTTSWTVTRGIDNTAAVAHPSGVTVSQVVAVQRVEPVHGSKQVSYLGRVSTFRTPGRAGTAGQTLFALHNGSGSPVLVDVHKLNVDLVSAAAAGVAPTVIPPIIRAWRFTTAPTNGTALSKNPENSALSSSSSVTVSGDASADGTGSSSALTVSRPAGAILTQEFAPRILVVGTSASTFYEPLDRTTFFENEDEVVTLRAGEGVCIFADYTAAAANPTTNHWLITCRWVEYTTA
jgi:hypothetical protein